MAYFYGRQIRVFFRTLHVGGEVLGTVNSIFVLQLNCTVVEKKMCRVSSRRWFLPHLVCLPRHDPVYGAV